MREILDERTLVELAVLAKCISARRAEERLTGALFCGADKRDVEHAIAKVRRNLERELALLESGEGRASVDPGFFSSS